MRTWFCVPCLPANLSFCTDISGSVYAWGGRLLKLGDPPTIESLESLDKLINLYEAWNKPEKAEEWRVKTTANRSCREVTLHHIMDQFLLAKSLQPEYNYTTPYLPIFERFLSHKHLKYKHL